MILYQMRSGDRKFFNNKYVIISQRLNSSRLQRYVRPTVVVSAYRRLIDVINPVIKFNSVTGWYSSTPNNR